MQDLINRIIGSTLSDVAVGVAVLVGSLLLYFVGKALLSKLRAFIVGSPNKIDDNALPLIDAADKGLDALKDHAEHRPIATKK